jgi:hypothetical protein
MQPSGMASMAVRVEIGDDHDSGRREILARRHKAQGEGRTDETGLTGAQRLGAAQPDIAQALLQENGGDGRGGDLRQGGNGFGCQGHTQGSSGQRVQDVGLTAAHLAVECQRVKGCCFKAPCNVMKPLRSVRLIANMRINLLKMHGYFQIANSTRW